MQNNFYVKESTTNFASKWQKPLPQNEAALEGKEIDWLYPTSRDEMIGNSKFVEEYNKLLNEFENRKQQYLIDNPDMKNIIDDCTTGDWK